MTHAVANANDLTTVPDRNADTVTALLDGQFGTVMRELARDAVSRAWMGGYLADASAVLLDVTRQARAFGMHHAALQERSL